MDAPFATCDIVRVTTRMKDGEHTFSCHVVRVWRNDVDDGWSFSYQPPPHYIPDAVQCMWGIRTLRDRPKRYGTQSVEVIAHQAWRLPMTIPQLYKNPAYDLIH